jgi:hypothetical protein
VYEGSVLLAKWVPFVEKAVKFSKTPELVTRTNETGQVELLVLVGINDINEADVRAIRTGQDPYGRLALHIELDEAGATKLQNLTRACLTHGYKRYFAEIIDGRVWAVPEITTTLHTFFAIPGDFNETTVEDMAERSGGKFGRAHPPSARAIAVAVFRIVVVLSVVLVLALGVYPASGLQPSKYPRAWLVVSAVACMVVGGYWLGVTKSVAGPDNPYGAPPWGDLIEINVLRVVAGAIIGAVAGVCVGYVLRFLVRQGLFNISRIGLRLVGGLWGSQGATKREAGAGQNGR